MAKSACVWMLLILTSATPAQAGCPKTSGMTDPVVMMCKDGYSHGTSVYIDTSAASGTDNEAGPVCTCSAEIRNANIVNITTHSSRDVCGSRLIYNLSSASNPFLDSGSCKEASFRKSVSQMDSLVIDLEKTETPFDADYCIHLEIETCKEDEFQCVQNGTCVPKALTCDSLPDCEDGSDEAKSYCRKISCQEGEVACAYDDKCYPSDKRCDNVTDCTDGSDEFGCGSGGEATITTEVPETGPVIYVNCTESTRFTTTTTTSTTTTSTTTTTTPTTTTTTPATTTTEATTTPVIVAATTESDTTIAATTESDTTTLPKTTTSTPETSTSTDALKTTAQSTSFMTSSVTQNTTSSGVDVVDPDVVKTNIWRNPVVIAGLVLGAVVALVILLGVPYVIYYKVKRMKSKTLKKSPDLWVDKNEEKELEPLNSPLP